MEARASSPVHLPKSANNQPQKTGAPQYSAGPPQKEAWRRESAQGRRNCMPFQNNEAAQRDRSRVWERIHGAEYGLFFCREQMHLLRQTVDWYLAESQRG